MQFENTFDVDAPLDQVWKTILDVEKVAPNVPGAEVLERTGDDAYKVGIKVKLGPITMQYRGDVEIVERDDEGHRAKMRVKAKETRGQGTADAETTMALSGDGEHTSATITTDVRLSGKAATMGRGIVQDVASRLVDTFAGNLAQSLEGPAPEPEPTAATPPPPPPREDALDVGGLAGGVLAARLRDPRALGVLALVALVL